MARIVVKNGHQNDIVTMRLDYVLKVDTIVGFNLSTIGRAYIHWEFLGCDWQMCIYFQVSKIIGK